MITKENLIEKINESKCLYLSKIGLNYCVYQTERSFNGLWLRILIHDTFFEVNTYLDNDYIVSSIFYFNEIENDDIYVTKYSIKIKNISFDFEYAKFCK
ncbi:hypothetical protein [Bullifex porci]|uniref:hypothetical protein n=1 Tax=Bullifex porci TaxID=2606638 RepID=UPI0023F2504E|nr:hypothetical protein [Bullifex porci]MDD7256161.1 hypothetical protein [Bullifex porci]